MSATGREPPDEAGDDDMLAAEFVLGVLPAAEQASLARRAEVDARFGNLVAGWEERLAPLAEGFAATAPAPGVKQALDRRLFGAEPRRGGGMWGNLTLWRSLAGVATAAFLLTVSLPYLAPPPAPGTPARYAATLSAEATGVQYLAVYDAAQGQVGLSRLSGTPAPGQDFELWVIRANTPPVSLGVIPAGDSSRLPLTDATRAMFEAGARLAITLEPLGGSPSGDPTGAVVAAGDLRNI